MRNVLKLTVWDENTNGMKEIFSCFKARRRLINDDSRPTFHADSDFIKINAVTHIY